MAIATRALEQVIDSAGRPVVAGFIYYGEYGKDPRLNPIQIYASEDLTTPLSNPLRTDMYGRPAATPYVGQDYSYEITDTMGITLEGPKNMRVGAGGLAPGSTLLVFESVEALKALKPFGASALAVPQLIGAQATTMSYYAGERSGGQRYSITTVVAERTKRGDPVWVPDGWGEFYLAGGTTYVAVISGTDTFFTPEMWGARGNGLTEDHLPIQAALDWIEKRGITTNLSPTRTYLCGDTIRARNFAWMVGPGKFVAKAGLNKQVLDIYAAYPVRRLADVVYADFRVDGNGADQAATEDNLLGACITVRASVENPTINGDALKRGEFENVTLNNITCVNGKINGFYVGKTTFVQRGYAWSGLKATGCVNGLFLDNYCEYVSFIGITMQKNSYGVRDNGASNCSFIGGTACNNNEAGIYIQTTGRNTSKKVIQGMLINHNARGIWIGNGVGTVGLPIDHISIVGNHILANSAQGVVGTGGVDVEVVGNFFSGNGSTANTADDIYMSAACKRWRVDNHHVNSTGKTRHAVYWLSPQPAGADSHAYHRVDGTFHGYSKAINYAPYGNPAGTPLNAHMCVVQGVFEYWNSANSPPSATAANGNASVNIDRIPFGTLCINNANNQGSEIWIKSMAPSSGGGAAAVSWRRVAAPLSGDTASRPTAPYVGMEYFDTTLNKAVWWTGGAWMDATGVAA